MELWFAIVGLAIGVSIAAPVGPIGVLCIRRSLAEGARIGFVVGLGAATADGVYGAVAAFGITSVSEFLVGQQFWLSLVGGVSLCYLGIRTIVRESATDAADLRGGNPLTAYVSTFFLTLSNPATILSFAAIFAGFGLGATPDYSSAASMVAGVFLGSALWWLALSTGVGFLRARVQSPMMRRVNWISGSVLFGFGLLALTLAIV